jgi:hypothetical protein
MRDLGDMRTALVFICWLSRLAAGHGYYASRLKGDAAISA